MAFISTPDGDLKKVFLTDAWLLDQFVGSTLWGWGDNVYGTLGNNAVSVGVSSPVQTVTGGTTWKQVSCGIGFTFAIKTDGTLWGWGQGNAGQLGDNSSSNKSSPAQTVTGGTTWKQVACGGLFTSAIKTDGTLWGWGYNICGQLGDSTPTTRSSPVQTVSGGTTWKQVACGYAHTAAIKTDGTLWTWGNNGLGSGYGAPITGQLGDNAVSFMRSSPVQTVSGGTTWKQVACGYAHTAAIKTDGTLWLWGYNYFGQIGDNTRTNRSSPVQTVSGGTTWKQVACGDIHTAAIKTDGTLWTWGNNGDGRLGDNTQLSRSSPVQTVSAGTNWKQVAGSGPHTAAIKNDGSVWNWGYNSHGEIGDNTNIIARSSPVQTVSAGTNWKQVACGLNHTAAVKNG